MPEIVQEIGAYAGLASVVGLAVLSALYFSQARDVKRLREWAGRAPERAEGQAPAVPGRVAAQPAGAPARPPSAAPPVPGPPGAPAVPAAPGVPGSPAVPGATTAATGARPATQAKPPPATPGPATPAGRPGQPVPADTGATAKPPGTVPVPAATAAATAAPTKPDAPGQNAGAASASVPDAPPQEAPAPGGSPPKTPASKPSPAPAAATTPAPASAPKAPAGNAGGATAVTARGAAAPPITGRSGGPSRPASQPTTVIPPRRRQAWYQSLLANPLYAVLAVVGVLVLGGAAVFGVSQLAGGSEDSTPGGQAADGASNGSAQSGQDADDAQNGGNKQRTGGAVKPANVTVAVLNGTTVPGLATTLADQVTAAGFKPGTVANFLPNQGLAESVVQYAPGHEREAAAVSRRLDIGQREAATAESRELAGDATVIVIAGGDKAP